MHGVVKALPLFRLICFSHCGVKAWCNEVWCIWWAIYFACKQALKPGFDFFLKAINVAIGYPQEVLYRLFAPFDVQVYGVRKVV